MFLEYQSISGNGLRRMMDAPIVATVKCQTGAGGKEQTGKQQLKTLTREVRTPPGAPHQCQYQDCTDGLAKRLRGCLSILLLQETKALFSFLGYVLSLCA